jgi:hypothetical protein
MLKNRVAFVTAAIVWGLPFAATAATSIIDLDGLDYITYGNTNSYSLPVLAYEYSQVNGGTTGPGNPYYIVSTPGAIKDLVVIYTGASGTDVTTNTEGFENAYESASGSKDYYESTVPGNNMTAPTGTKDITTQYASTWDANLLYLKAFLDGGDPLFLFNNNDTNKDQNLAIWAKLWITDGNGDVYNDQWLYLSNQYPNIYGTGGDPSPGDAYSYNPGDIQPSSSFGSGGVLQTDYVLSGGDVCVLDADTFHLGACTSAEKQAGWETINHNLGANQVAYVGDVPLLNDWLSILFGLSDVELGMYSLHLQLNLGCDPVLVAYGVCEVVPNYINIDNGYEQLFLASSKQVFENPEPATLALFGLGLFGIAAIRRRMMAK